MRPRLNEAGMAPGSSGLVLLALSLLPLAVAVVEPREAVWSSKAVGADGPWNAVEVSLGSQPKIALFPGRQFNSWVTTSDYCALNNSVPHCAAGTYLKDKAVAGSTTSGKRIDYKPTAQGASLGIPVAGSTANLYTDTIDLQFDSGVIRNHAIGLIETQMLSYPSGTWYPFFAGCLSLGAPDRMQVFTGATSSSTVNTTMIPWSLKEDAEVIESSSFGLHYGSAAPSAKMSGSLIYGGYDRNRVVGDVLVSNGGFGELITLQDISIRVIKGSSPFPDLPTDTNIQTGLLAKGNSSISSAGIPVRLDPCSPYLSLPKSTCDAIAEHLPVTYDSGLGLYLWNTSSPRYAPVVASASALSLTFMGASNTDSLTVNLPFPHLNLTLSPPFVDSPVPYFPCFTGGTENYVLGRAFFQDAFLGGNWEAKKTWLAQAPGPNVPAGGDVASVAADQEEIEKGGNEWEKSWEGFWKALTKEEASGEEGVDAAGGGDDGGESNANGVGGQSEVGETSGGGGLSTGAIAGIAVGAAVVALGLLAAAFFWWRRRRAAEGVMPPGGDGGMVQAIYQDKYAAEPAGWAGATSPAAPAYAPGPVEVPGNDGLNEVFEMPGDRPNQVNGWQPR